MSVTFNLFWIVLIFAIVVIVYFIKECFFKTKDTNITTNIIDKFPLVSWGFRQKSLKEQNIENNQEIHENNKKIQDLENRIQHLELCVKSLNDNIQEQLKAILEELESRG